MTRYVLPDDPYHGLGATGVDPAQIITPEEVAAAVVDAAESEPLPLRVPIGDMARTVLAARRAAPDDVPFVVGQPAEANR